MLCLALNGPQEEHPDLPMAQSEIRPFMRTCLDAIPDHALYLLCYCGHGSTVTVSKLLAAGHAGAFVQDIAARARCMNCLKRGAQEVRIVYIGGSSNALDGSRTQDERFSDA